MWRGLIEADLGACVVKKRVARGNRGKNGGALAYRAEGVAAVRGRVARLQRQCIEQSDSCRRTD